MTGGTALAGTWTPLKRTAPGGIGLMMLLPDGTVMAKSSSGGGDGYGNTWYRLTPDSQGSYVNGTWTALAPMQYTRLYGASQVLTDGRVFVAGGEYGTGKTTAEVYNPLTDSWTQTPTPGHTFSDSNSEILPDRRVLVALVEGSLRSTLIYNPVTNTWTTGPTCNGIHNESAWVKLPDDSILFVDRLTTNSERYIPASNTWITDAALPVSLYDPYGLECGPGMLLPNGKVIMFGATGHTAIYTPSGSTANGSWVAGPDFPNGQGMPDAPCVMLPNGRVLCATSPIPTSANHFPSPTSFYEYDYTTNSFTAVPTTTGGTLNHASYLGTMLGLPDGTALYSDFSTLIYSYQGGGTPMAAAQPAITSITPNADGSYHLVGTQLNGINERSCYGDDNQNATNYPIVRLTSGSNVYYARTYGWSRTSVATSSTPVTTEFVVPASVPNGTYSLAVVANGIASSPVSFSMGANLALSFDSDNVTEGSAPVTATLTATPTPVSSLTVNLSSSDLNSATVPATVTIPAGQTSVTFPVTIIDNALLDGTRNVAITASAATYLNGVAALTVNDNETATLGVSAPSSVNEGVGSILGTLTTSIPPSTAVVVQLSSSDTSTLTVPATVTIPAGQTSVNFTIAVINDTKINGTRSVTITAHEANWTDGVATISVLDNDVHHFVVSAIPPSQIRGMAFAVSVTAVDVNGVTISSYTGTANLSANGDGGADSISPTVTSAFSSGVWTGSVTVNSFDTNVVLLANDSTGHAGTSNTFNVGAGALHHFAWNIIGTPQTKNVPIAVTVTAQDAGNNTITSFTGMANLSAATGGGAVSISPTVSGNFIAGAWSGNVTFLQGAIQAHLHADDGASHTGDSNAFDVLGDVPTVTTVAATPTGPTTATLRGTVNANGSSSTVSFDYGLTTAYGSTIAGTPSPVTGTATTNVTAAISGLAAGTTYHYRVNATNAYGTTSGSDLTFTTVNNSADLSNLVISAGTLTPTFSSSTTSYTASVPYATSTITLTPTVAATGSTVKVNGVAVASGNASSAIGLNVGSNTITAVVTAQDGVTTKTYSVVVTRAAASTNALLGNLVFNFGTLSPAFSPTTTSYTMNETNGISIITATPSVVDPTATVKVNGVTVASGSASGNITLAEGGNLVSIVVTAQSGATQTYSVVVTRARGVSTFTTTGSMSTSRTNHVAVLLNNGKVLVAGGYASATLATAELYDPSTGQWSATGSLLTLRQQMTGTLLPNGKVLVAGGNTKTCELYDPTTGTWASTGSLNTLRTLHNAVLLQSGKVLVCGGQSGTTGFPNAELFDPATGTWTVTGSMNTGRYAACATLLPSGKVLVAGGLGTGGTALATSEIYDPGTGQWTPTTTPMQVARYYMTLTVLPNGKAVAIGGATATGVTGDTEIYDPATNGWTQVTGMFNGLYFHTASLLPNGKVLVAGGGNSAQTYDYTTGIWSSLLPLAASHSQHTATALTNGKLLIAGGGTAVAEILDSAVATWTNTANNMTVAHEQHIAKLLPNGKVIVVGTLSNSSVTDLYDPATGTWSSTGSLVNGRSATAAVLLGNGKVLLASGYTNGPVTSSELYDYTQAKWSSTGNLNQGRGNHTATLLANGKVLVVGGVTSSGSNVLNSCELYDPNSGAWTVTGSLPTPVQLHVAVLLQNGKVLVAGGQNGSSSTGVAYLYDPAAGTWSATGSLNTPRDNFSATLLPNGQVLVEGGGAGAGVTNTAELYNPATGTWTTTGNMAIARWLHSATLLPNGKVLVAGGNGPPGDLADCELYDPATRTWSWGGNLNIPRSGPVASLLTNGQVLVMGGYSSSNGGYQSTAEVFDPGLGFSTAWQPNITSATNPLAPGNNLVVSGTGLTGVSGASYGGTQDSSSNYPLVQLLSLENGQTAFLSPNPSVPWSSTAFTSSPVSGFPYGYAMATVFTNGIPSTSVMVNIAPSWNADLSNLALSAGTLTPAFSSGTTSYTASVANAMNSITVTPTTADANASVTVNSVTVTSGTSTSPITLNLGTNTINVLVTAQDGLATKTYSVVVTRQTPYQDWATNLGLSGAALDPLGDYSNTGLKNMLKWAYATGTASGVNFGPIRVSGGALVGHGVPTVYTPDGVHYFALFGRRKDAATVGLTYGVAFSNDLSAWTNSTDVPTVIAQDSEIEAVTVPFPSLPSGQQRTFFHVNVTAQ